MRHVLNSVIQQHETQIWKVLACVAGILHNGANLQDAEQGYNHAASTCGRGTEYDTFYLITSQTIDSTTDVVQLVVYWRAVMLSPAELNNIFHLLLPTPL